MPRRSSSVMQQRVDKKRRLRNYKVKQELKKTLKKFAGLISHNKAPDAKELLVTVSSRLDKAAKKGIIHPNTASRKKSRLAKQILKIK